MNTYRASRGLARERACRSTDRIQKRYDGKSCLNKLPEIESLRQPAGAPRRPRVLSTGAQDPGNRLFTREAEARLKASDQVRYVERVTGIEPAYPAWK